MRVLSEVGTLGASGLTKPIVGESIFVELCDSVEGSGRDWKVLLGDLLPLLVP